LQAVESVESVEESISTSSSTTKSQTLTQSHQYQHEESLIEKSSSVKKAYSQKTNSEEFVVT
jgi:hypothetical protein